MVQGFGGRARFRVENYGDSELARRFGVTRYPAIFVDDILVATPSDFGFYGNAGPQGGAGRYAPLRSAASHERFRADLTRMLELVLAGKRDEARAAAQPARPGEVAAYPEVTITDLDGKSLRRADLAGKIVLVEIWATWCPPCHQTLRVLGELAKRHGERVAVVTLAIESAADGVREVAKRTGARATWALGSPEVVRAFGDVAAVPTLLVFGPDGRTAAVHYGAPPTLAKDLEDRVLALLSGEAGR